MEGNWYVAYVSWSVFRLGVYVATGTPFLVR